MNCNSSSSIVNQITYFYHAKIYDESGRMIEYSSGSVDFRSTGNDLHEVYGAIVKDTANAHSVDTTRVEITQLNRL